MGSKVVTPAFLLALVISFLPARADDQFHTILDSATGIRIDLPLNVLTVERMTSRGRNWSSSDKGISVDTLAFPPERPLETIYETLRSIKGRTTARSEVKPNSFILEGRDADGSNFYIAAHQKDDAIRGISVVIADKRSREYGPLLKRIVQSFEAFPVVEDTVSSDRSSSTSADSNRISGAGKPPITIVPNIGELTYTYDAILSPDGATIATFEGVAWSSVKLWDIASGRPLRTLEYFAFFTAVSFSPDGKLIASAHKDGNIKLWEVATGRNVATFKPAPQRQPSDDPIEAWSVWIDATGELLVSGDSAGRITVWDIAQQQRVYSFTNQSERIIAARLSQDRRNLTALTQNAVNVFDVQTRKVIASFKLAENHSFAENSIVGDGQFIVRFLAPKCEIDELRFLSLRDPKNLQVVDKAPKCQRSKEDDALNYFYGEPKIFSSPGQSTIVVARRGVPEVKLWDLQLRRSVRTIKWTNDASANVIAVSRDNRLAAARDANRIHIHDLESGTLVKEFTTYGYPADNAVVSEDGRHVLLSHKQSSSSKQKDVHLWQADEVNPKKISVPVAGDTIVHDFAISSNTGVAAKDEGGEIILFSTDNGEVRRRFSVRGITEIFEVRLSTDGKLISLLGSDGSEQTAALLLDAKDGNIKLSMKGRESATAVAFSADGSKVAVGRYGVTEIWSTETLKRINLLRFAKGNEDQPVSLLFSSDGQYLIAGSRDSGIYMWSITSGRLVRHFESDNLAGHVNVSSVAISRDGKLVAGGLSERARSSGDLGSERGIKVWDAETGKLRFALRGHERGVRAVAFSPDDRRIISASYDGTIRYWDRTDGKWLATFAAAEGGRWLVITERGFFAGSLGSEDLINVVRGLESFSVAQFRLHLYRIDLVQSLLKGDPERRYKDAAHLLDLDKILASGSAPQIELLPDKQIERAGDTVRVTVRINDTGSGIGEEVVWRVNGVTGGTGERQRQSSIQSGTGYRIVTETLRVNPGQKNIIEVTAYNGKGLLASETFRITIDPFGDSILPRPRMFVIAIGISNYVREDWRLQYAANDATAFSERLKLVASGLYEDVQIRVVPEEQATRQGIASAFNEIKSAVRATDVFVLFVAGHGRTMESTGTYYFFQRDLTFESGRSIEDGIGQDTWQLWLKQIAAQKSILIFDTCESSAAVGLTRGGKEREAAIDRLRDATGRSIITAARQAAYEGYHGHGVLTYAILDALTAKDAGKEQEVDLYQLAAQVDRDVPEISYSLFGVRQRPLNKIEGNFPIGMTKAVLATRDTPAAISAVPTHVVVRVERIRERPTFEAPGDHQLGLGTQVRVVQFVGDWAIVARDGQKLGYLPANALLKLQ